MSEYVWKGWPWFGIGPRETMPGLQVCPYMAGAPVYRDGMLPFLYTKLRGEDKIKAMFCGDDKNMDAFVTFFSRVIPQVLCEVHGTTLKPVGISWVDLARGQDGYRVAMCGEAFFDGATKTHSARDLARLSLAYAMHELRIDVFHGVQLASAYAARNFALKLGWEDTAIIPSYHAYDGALVDARIMTLHASKFLPPTMEWIESFKAAPKDGDATEQKTVEI